MKIGILTLPLHANYGGILQAYALQTIMKRLGHEVCHVEPACSIAVPDPILQRFIKYPIRLVKKIFINHGIVVRAEYKHNKTISVIQKYTRPFINKYLNIRFVNTYSNIKENDYNAYVVGSDQVWRPDYISNIENVFLDFTQGWNVKRIAYAASFGVDRLFFTDMQKARGADLISKRLLRQFDAVSVREDSGVDICMDFAGVQATCVLDPTLLLSVDDYNSLIKDKRVSKGDEILSYVLDNSDNITNFISNISKYTGISVRASNNTNIHNENIPLKNRIQPPVEDWLRGFRDCKAVITDSFHACVFSVIYNKPFIVLGNKSRGMSRFESFLSKLGLNNRMVNDTADMQQIKNLLNTVPNVQERMESLKTGSMAFLMNNLM